MGGEKSRIWGLLKEEPFCKREVQEEVVTQEKRGLKLFIFKVLVSFLRKLKL